jgi:hypothetical protein
MEMPDTSNPAKLLSDLLEAVEGAEGKQPCKLCVALKDMTAPEREGIQLAMPKLSYENMHAILHRNGIRVPRRAVRTHKMEGHKI